MEPFNQLIREARKSLGFPTAKEFHRRKTRELSMSYESYANLEAGKYLPPAEKLTNLLQALEIEQVQDFVHSYCATLMPNHFFKGFFTRDESKRSQSLVLKASGENYKEKFQALLQFNRIQAKSELTDKQIAFLEKDLVTWDVINLFISSGDEGFSVEEIAHKTHAGADETLERVNGLVSVGMLKKLPDGKYLVTQDAFIIPRRPVADGLTHALIRRELERSYEDKRNRPYARFRFMSISPEDRENVEMFIDNFILDSRRFKKADGGKTHYLHVLFSDRNDL